MIKSILVPAGGSDTDFPVFETALAVARACEAHLDFFHVNVGSEARLRYTPHADFVRGAAIREALREARDEETMRARTAERHVREFCEQRGIAIVESRSVAHAVSASWHQEPGHDDDPLMLQARVHDLVVMGRFTQPNGLPPNLLQMLLVGSGRPILIAAKHASKVVTGTVMVAWKDAAEAARAVTAAMPLLARAERAVIVTIDEGGSPASGARALARQLEWHGIRAQVQVLAADGRHSIAESLSSAAELCTADLMIMGGYGTGPWRQAIFGGCTRSVLERADVPVFLLH